MLNKCKLLASFFLVISLPISAYADVSSFDSPELTMQPSPAESKTLKLESSDTVIGLDVAPNRPEAAFIVKKRNGREELAFWNIGRRRRSLRLLDVPKNITVSALAWHPLGKSLFLLGKSAGKEQILTTNISEWVPTVIYNSRLPLRSLVVSPRPFGIGIGIKYRVFFGVGRADGTFSTHSISESGGREYAVLDSKLNPLEYSNDRVKPNTIIAKDALPVRFHPAGHFMLWENGNHCFRKAVYAGDNWNDKPEDLHGSASFCNGSMAFTPNGAALLHWRNGKNGVELVYDHGTHVGLLAGETRFLSMPASVPDGRGLIGVTASAGRENLTYIPVDVPLADVANAWMFLESTRDRELFTANTGLFRSLNDMEQLFQLYDTESYSCKYGYNESLPTRPYLVSTDIFWELYAAAFEGIFVLSERESAMPAFWDFVTKAGAALSAGHPHSNVAKIFSALLEIHHGRTAPDSESGQIMRSEGKSHSLITGEKFDFGNLIPRGHYITDTDLQKYFRASKYLMDISLTGDDIALLKSLPQEIRQKALAWIQVYEPFIAPSRSPLIWKRNAVPEYIQSPPKVRDQVFPLSWGVDNEILFNVQYHKASEAKLLPPLPSGLDIADVLGSKVAEVILDQSGEFAKYPLLKARIAKLRGRLGESKAWSKPSDRLYELWMAGLASQWADSVTSPHNVIQKQFWQRKRLQTGLASWATLRHSTVLVNERTGAECGESGFEDVILTPPRGYVEPDPKTFEAIAKLFDAVIVLVKSNGAPWRGVIPGGQVEDNGLQNGIIRRLMESRENVRAFRAIAVKEIEGKPLSSRDYEDILYVGRAAEYNLLIFKSLAKKDFALATPDPITKVSDVAANSDFGVLSAGVGRPAEWDQVVPYFGRRELVKGVAYSYYENTSPSVMTDKEWTRKVGSLPHPAWIAPYFSRNTLSCPPVDP